MTGKKIYNKFVAALKATDDTGCIIENCGLCLFDTGWMDKKKLLTELEKEFKKG